MGGAFASKSELSELASNCTNVCLCWFIVSKGKGEIKGNNELANHRCNRPDQTIHTLAHGINLYLNSHYSLNTIIFLSPSHSLSL